MHVLPLNDPSFARLSTVALVAIVKNGQGKMPHYSDKLTDAQIKDVVSYTMALARR